MVQIAVHYQGTNVTLTEGQQFIKKQVPENRNSVLSLFSPLPHQLNFLLILKNTVTLDIKW